MLTGKLLEEFFCFYAQFDFQTMAISVIKGQTYKKLDEQQAMYIENPLETELNVSKNVNAEHSGKFQTACQHASKILEESKLSTQRDDSNWGLLRLLENPDTGATLSKIFSSPDDTKPLANENKTDSSNSNGANKSDTLETRSEDSLLSRPDFSTIFSDSSETITNDVRSTKSA